ncbi:hypothetical protein FO519_005188 [Halicephalobus sp. NKZ332]|nr:hypothetical protein FO519_005188 [Halicephalobus sp. NKZ332]
MEVLLFLEYCSTALATGCIPINLLFLHLLYRYRHKRPFKSSFFDLCRILTIADILMMIFSTIFFKLPVYGWIPEYLFHDNFAVVPLMGVNYFSHVQAIGIIGIALNRFTAVFSPIRHRDFWWTSTRLKIFTILQWTLPISIILPLFFAKFEKIPNKHTGGILFNAIDRTFHRWYFLGIAILDGLVITLFVVLIYIGVFLRVKTHALIKKPNELALRLATSAFLISACYLILGIFSLLSALAPASDPWMYRSVWFIVNDILCSTNALILLALNKPIRKIFLRISDNECSVESQEIKVKIGSKDWIHGFRSLERYISGPTDKSIFVFLNGTDFMENFNWDSEWKKPVKIIQKGGLGMRLPLPGFDIHDLESLVDGEKIIDVTDIYLQETIPMKLRTFFGKWKKSSRKKIFNISSWGFSGSPLADFVRPPDFLYKLSWVKKIWERNSDVVDEFTDILYLDHEFDSPDVDVNCFLEMAGSFANFRINLGGSSAWHHVFKGQKIFYMFPPTKANLKAYSKWIQSLNKDELFMPTLARNELKRIVVNEGETILIPSGWIHATFVPEDSIVFGGYFLHELNIRMQLKIHRMEKKIHNENSSFPKFELINWYTARALVRKISDANEKNEALLKHSILSLMAFHDTLKSWKEKDDEESNADHSRFHPVVIQLGEELTKYRKISGKRKTTMFSNNNPRKKLVTWLDENIDVECQLESEIIPGLLGITPGGRRPKRKDTNGRETVPLINPQPIPKRVSIPYKPLSTIIRPFPEDNNFAFLSSKPLRRRSPSTSSDDCEVPICQNKIMPTQRRIGCIIL